MPRGLAADPLLPHRMTRKPSRGQLPNTYDLQVKKQTAPKLMLLKQFPWSALSIVMSNKEGSPSHTAGGRFGSQDVPSSVLGRSVVQGHRP